MGVVFVASPAQLMGTITMDVLGASAGSISISNAEEIHHAVEAGGITVWGMDKATVISVWTAIIFITTFLQHYFQLIKSSVVSTHSSEHYYSSCL